MNLIDLHQDLAFSSQRQDVIHGSGQSSVDMLSSLGNAMVFSVVFPHIYTENERAEELSRNYGFRTQSSAPLVQVAMEQFKFYYYLERTGRVRIVRNVEDTSSCGLLFLISMEGTDVLTDPYDLDLYYNLGLRNLGITWNYDTKFGSSCMSKVDYGLTGYGTELVERCNSLGIIVDLAHASKRTVLDTCSVTGRPVICSHANAASVHRHVRNLDDEEIEAIVDTGGVIGITAITSTLGPSASMDDMVKHAEYIGNNFGWEHVAIGSDFLGIEKTPSGFEDVTKYGKLRERLGTHADQVMWSNALRVITENLRS
ncbi:peptidase [Thermogymnomonas acidicola]|uniref:Peptidase n=1 Tax=Thermogymnomonas acidicola TaxID=399579 RepID=A0AA37F912_9ARCH|nr:dipeptidase [Thermogymnomonas acidicola]GGM70220.1 peptidase [Thermogymnomonas acidicola]